MLMDALEADPQLCEEARGRAGDAVRTGHRRAAVLPLALRHCVPTARACVAALLAALTAAALCAYLQVTRLRLGPPRSTAKASPEALWEQAKTWAASGGGGGGGGRGSSLSPSVRRRGGRGRGRAPATPVAARAVPPPGPALSSPEVQKAMLEEAARPLRLTEGGTRGTKRLLDDKWAEINGVACDQLTVRAKAVHTTAVAPQAGGDNPARSLKVRHVAPCTCAMRAVCWLLAVAVMFAVCRMCATGCAARCAARVAVARVCPHAARSV